MSDSRSHQSCQESPATRNNTATCLPSSETFPTLRSSNGPPRIKIDCCGYGRVDCPPKGSLQESESSGGTDGSHHELLVPAGERGSTDESAGRGNGRSEGSIGGGWDDAGGGWNWGLDLSVADLGDGRGGCLDLAIGNLGDTGGLLDLAVGDLRDTSWLLDLAIGDLGDTSWLLDLAVSDLGDTGGCLDLSVADLGHSGGSLDLAISNDADLGCGEDGDGERQENG